MLKLNQVVSYLFFSKAKLSVKDVEQLIKPPAITQKDLHHGSSGRRTSILPSASIHEVFRDYKPTRVLRSNLDPVSTNGQHLLELFGLEKKGARNEIFKSLLLMVWMADSQKKLYQLWETRASTPNIPVVDDLLQLLKQHSRVVHFCLTPLLYLPRYTLKFNISYLFNYKSYQCFIQLRIIF